VKHSLLAVAAAALLGAGALTSCAFSSRLRTEAINRPLADVDRASVSIEAGVAELTLGALGGPGVLIEGTADVPERSSLETQYRVSGGTAFVSYREEDDRGTFVIPVAKGSPHWDLALTREVPLDLDVETGVGEARLELSSLRVEKLELTAGVGKTEVTLPARGLVVARIESGIGSVHVNVPAGMEVRVRSETGLGHLDMRGRALEGSDGDFRTAGYDDAANRVDLEVKSGIGSVVVDVR
jgi:hypothetical protein